MNKFKYIPPYYTLSPISFYKVNIQNGFWKERQIINKEISLPLMLEKLEEDHHIDNFRVASEKIEGIHKGEFYYDSDLYKFIEGAVYFSVFNIPENFNRRVQNIINLIEKSQLDDGYLNTYYSLNFLEDRFTNFLWLHELYCAGHLIEAAVAQKEITGQSTLLKVANKFIKLLFKEIVETKRQETDGHPEIEMALIRLYRTTQNPQYLEFCRYLINIRGHIPHLRRYVFKKLLNALKTFKKADQIKEKYHKMRGLKEISNNEVDEFMEDFTLGDWITFLKENLNGKFFQLNKPIKKLKSQ